MQLLVQIDQGEDLDKGLRRGPQPGQLALTFDEGEHPRAPAGGAGQYRGGQFVPKDEPGSTNPHASWHATRQQLEAELRAQGEQVAATIKEREDFRREKYSDLYNAHTRASTRYWKEKHEEGISPEAQAAYDETRARLNEGVQFIKDRENTADEKELEARRAALQQHLTTDPAMLEKGDHVVIGCEVRLKRGGSLPVGTHATFLHYTVDDKRGALAKVLIIQPNGDPGSVRVKPEDVERATDGTNPFQVCGRCGGGGRYSWNAINGDTCFGCNGLGLQVTKPAKEKKPGKAGPVPPPAENGEKEILPEHIAEARKARKAGRLPVRDRYQEGKAPREEKGQHPISGDVRYGYAYSPDYFVRSDATGRMCRFYLLLPNGAIIHPDELDRAEIVDGKVRVPSKDPVLIASPGERRKRLGSLERAACEAGMTIAHNWRKLSPEAQRAFRAQVITVTSMDGITMSLTRDEWRHVWDEIRDHTTITVEEYAKRHPERVLDVEDIPVSKSLSDAALLVSVEEEPLLLLFKARRPVPEGQLGFSFDEEAHPREAKGGHDGKYKPGEFVPKGESGGAAVEKPKQDGPIYHDTYTGPRFTYGGQNRPLGYAAIPNGFIGGSQREHPSFRHGVIDYPRELTPDETYGYELERVYSDSEAGGMSPEQIATAGAWIEDYKKEIPEMSREDKDMMVGVYRAHKQGPAALRAFLDENRRTNYYAEALADQLKLPVPAAKPEPKLELKPEPKPEPEARLTVPADRPPAGSVAEADPDRFIRPDGSQGDISASYSADRISGTQNHPERVPTIRKPFRFGSDLYVGVGGGMGAQRAHRLVPEGEWQGEKLHYTDLRRRWARKEGGGYTGLVVQSGGKRWVLAEEVQFKERKAAQPVEEPKAEETQYIWQQTRKESLQGIMPKRHKSRLDFRREAVERAAREGKPVPDHVLAEYPDLHRQFAGAREAA